MSAVKHMEEAAPAGQLRAFFSRPWFFVAFSGMEEFFFFQKACESDGKQINPARLKKGVLQEKRDLMV